MTPFFILTVALAADPVAYVKPDLLVEAAVIIKDAKPYRILDTRANVLSAGAIPGSGQIPLAYWDRAMKEGKADAAFWKGELAKAGVEPNKPVIVTGTDVREICRAWWLLKYAGVKDVRILNGGHTAYRAAGGAIAAESTTTLATPHDWTLDAKRFSGKSDLLVTVEDKVAQIVDARSAKEFTGEQAMSKKGGHVPGAKALEWKDLIDVKTDKFKTAAELKSLFAERKIDLTKPCTTYCQSGGRASVMAFALELMGATDVRNYYKSWSEWGNADDTPVEKK